MDLLTEFYSKQIEEQGNARRRLEQFAEAVGSAERENLTLAQQLQLQEASQAKTEWFRANIQLIKAQGDLKVLQDRLSKLGELEVPIDELSVLVAANPYARQLTDELGALRSGTDHAGALLYNKSDHFALGRIQQRINEINERLAVIEDEERLKWKVDQRKALEIAIAEKQGEVEVFGELKDACDLQVETLKASAQGIGVKSVNVEMTRAEIERLDQAIEDVSHEIQLAKMEEKGGDRLETLSRGRAARFCEPAQSGGSGGDGQACLLS